MTTTVPYHDWENRYQDWTEQVLDAVRAVADSDEFILKSRVAALEAQVAERTGAKHAIAVANATGGLTVLLAALGLGEGDEVVTPAFSFISTASTVALRGAKPVFADVDHDTACLDLAAARAAMTSRTKALLPAYLFSTHPDMTGLAALAQERGVALIEDSAVALGATVDGRPAGRFGTAGVFSFFPAKPIGGAGDAGMVVTDDDELAREVRMLRNHGQDLGVRFLHHKVGYNCRMDEISAAFLLHRLPRLDEFLGARRRIAEEYQERLAPLAPELLTPPDGYDHRAVYTYVVRARRRDALRAHLAAEGIEAVVYYPRPLHLQPAFAYLGHAKGDFPVAERLAEEALALPLHPDMRPGDVARVAAAIERFYRGAGR
ncbi:UDP-2-acetamido-2-deoxy-ribo-hexuluronate aminotransferase [Kitasatospora sp. MMS16-BH015]|uniref:DegT/DnrJ/EryC1/StrS family aminotransferase n=1 Tax=Kitasatospora sp. MMS16-BH015 TaxID=2018025 RepID=UPI000CA3BE12|nr:DegT/DnrJ/EryC1/StrS family aminotransferase [Kitasatospora sp. MMS16-BH015]AUG80406.1 UDP-2-acetamido-2-deoxy-ribo-hexuluronate aminotransferase [Kitasatospora sp. MMS16-BH015]